jgi:two-component system chemotaxis response regulator CheB
MAVRRRDVVVIGGSAGAVEALFRLCSMLPADLGAAIAIVIHRHPTFKSSLAELLGHRSILPVLEPRQAEPFTRGRIYLAPPDRHMTIHNGLVTLDRTPKQHHTRPAIDPLFVSAANSYADRVVGVLLTGNLSDGVTGLIEVKRQGGLSLVQDPAEAPFPSMPRNALIYDHVDLIFGLDTLPEILERLVQGESIQSATKTVGARAVRESDVEVPPWLMGHRRLP